MTNFDVCAESAKRGKLTYMTKQPWNAAVDNFIDIGQDPDFNEYNLNERWMNLFDNVCKELKLNLKFNK